MSGRSPRLAALLQVAAMMVVQTMTVSPPAAQAISRPIVDPARVPMDNTPGPGQPMRQSNVCAEPIAVADPDVAVSAPSFAMLNISRTWQYSTGNGVRVAVVDTGVNPSPRLPVIGGGDYILGGDGLSDCDAHGTIVASLIGAAPRGMPMPEPMPKAAKPPPAVTDSASATPDGSPAPPTESLDQLDDAEMQPEAPDGVAGVAPHALILSIRQSSRAFEPEHPAGAGQDERKKAGTIATLAAAIVHAAEMGAQVINVSVTSCVSAADPLDQGGIGAAVWYAATVKDAVIVAAAGNDGEDDCAQNPIFNPLDPSDPRDWRQVKTVSSPSWFSDYVLSVGAIDNTGSPISKSMAGPWVALAAPGVGIMGLSPQTGAPVNAYPPARPGEKETPFWGTSFSAAYVSGVAALVRAKFPGLSAHQVINRMLQTAHNPPRGVDNQVGYGVIDPVAALTFDVPPGDRAAPGAQARVIVPAPGPPPPDHRARAMALVFAGVMAGAVVLGALIDRARRVRRR